MDEEVLEERDSSSDFDAEIYLDKIREQRKEYRNALLEIENELSKVKARKKELEKRIVIDLVDEHEDTDEFGAHIECIKDLAESKGLDRETVDEIIRKEEEEGRLFSLGGIWVSRVPEADNADC